MPAHERGTILFMPLTLHAAWLRSDQPFPSGNLFFWAEHADVSVPKATDIANVSVTNTNGGSTNARSTNHGTNNRQRTPKIPSHPNQIAVGQLRSTLLEEFPALAATQLSLTNAEIWLPSRNGLPLTRRNLSQSAPTTGARTASYSPTTTLAAWQITGLMVTPLIALRVLSHLNYKPGSSPSGASTFGQQLRLGNDLLFWSNAAKYTLELLVGQHYLPGLQPQRTDGFVALWQPALYDLRVEDRLDQLVQTMPPVCRAYNLASLADAPAPVELLEHFITTLIDTAIRAWDNHSTNGASDHTPASRPILAWLDKLITGQHLVNLPPQPAYQLYQDWRAWTEQLYVTRDANFRICFQLEAPDEAVLPAALPSAVPPVPINEPLAMPGDEATWTLRYYLQARDNPQLMVSARQVWETPNNALRFGSRLLDKPQERLLAGLGMASRLFAPIHRSLRSPRPETAQLSTAEAYQFLREIGPLLENSGFGLLLPDSVARQPPHAPGLASALNR